MIPVPRNLHFNFKSRLIFILCLAPVILLLSLPTFASSPKNCRAVTSNTKTLVSLNKEEGDIGFPSLIGENKYFGLSSLPDVSFQFERTDSWGASRDFAGKGISVKIMVKDIPMAKQVIKLLSESMHINTSEIFSNPELKAIDLENGIYAEIKTTQASSLITDPAVWIKLTNQYSQSIDAGQSLVQALIENGLHIKEETSINDDLSNNSGRHAWAIRNFKNDKNLTSNEKMALVDLSGPDYKDINSSLRTPGARKDPRVPFIDSAISKGRLNRKTTVYRAVERSDVMQIWNDMNEGRLSTALISPDPAYLFTSMDPKVALWWPKEAKLKNPIFLVMELPAGLNAAYIDSEIRNDRGFFEIVLPKNLKMQAVSALKEGTTQILKVKVEN